MGIVVLSECEKGIDNSASKLLPDASHSFSAFHIQKNVKALFKTSLKGLVFEAAKAWTVEDFAAAIEKIKAMNVAAGNYLENIDPTKWARALFPAQRLGHVTSNMSESMNKWLEQVRHLCPVEIFEAYIEKLNILFEKRRNKYASIQQPSLPPYVARIFSKSVEESRKLDVRKNTRRLFKVQRRNDPTAYRTVDLLEGKCTCGFYDEYGIPCRHLCAACLFLGDHPHNLVIQERTITALQTMYRGETVPVDVNMLNGNGLKVPGFKKKRGRPKEKR